MAKGESTLISRFFTESSGGGERGGSDKTIECARGQANGAVSLSPSSQDASAVSSSSSFRSFSSRISPLSPSPPPSPPAPPTSSSPPWLPPSWGLSSSPSTVASATATTSDPNIMSSPTRLEFKPSNSKSVCTRRITRLHAFATISLISLASLDGW